MLRARSTVAVQLTVQGLATLLDLENGRGVQTLFVVYLRSLALRLGHQRDLETLLIHSAFE